MEIDNTTGTIAAIENGNQEYIAKISTLLGPKYSLPKGGVIRPGIMVLKPGCSKEDEKAYSEMACSGVSWDDIEKKLGQDGKGKSKLRPANVDYFTVNPGDCMNPDNARVIKEKYADADGKIRRLPIWFPVNEWWNILPHSLRCWGQSGIRFMSDITNGKTVCRFPIDAAAGVRTFGGRQWGTRPCKPEECKEYQSGECKFGGMIQFYIPGVKGAGIWVLPTTSWYSMVAIKSVIENVAAITGGRVARLFNEEGESVFVLTKTEETVASVDWKTGKAVQRTQYLIYLDLNIDMTELALMHDRKSITARATAAAEKLNGGNSGVKVVEAAPEVVETKVVEAAPAKKEAAEETPVTPAEAKATNSNGAKKKALLKECVALKNTLPEETYKEIRAKYPEDSAAWTMEETEGFHAALKAAAVKPAESTPEAEEKVTDNGALTDELLAAICAKALEYGIDNELCKSITSHHAKTEAIARNWLARLEQGDFTMYLEALK